MDYLKFSLTDPKRDQDYRDFLGQISRGVERSAGYLLRTIQLMSPQDEKYYHGVVFLLARHIAEEVDATSILCAQGSAEACKSHLRSAFEAELGLRYILETDSERRAVAYHVKEFRERLQANQRYDARTPEGQKVRAAVENDPIGADILDKLPPYDFDADNASLTSKLSSPPYQEVNTEWDGKGKKAPWYSLFGGPRTVRELAERLKKSFWYEFLYSDWSAHLHAGSALRHAAANSKEPDRSGAAVRPLRHPEGILEIYRLASGIAILVGHTLSERYLSQIGKDDLRALYIREIQPISRQLDNAKVSAPWH